MTEAIRMQVRETVVRRTAEGRAFDQDQIDLDIAPMLETLRADPSFRTDLREAFASEIRFHEAQKFDEKGSDALDVFTAVRPALRKNPRQYVRFFNTLRFDNYLDSLSPPIGPPRERLLFLAKRTVLFLEWPELWALVVRQSNSFENLILAVEKGDTEFEEFLEGLYDGIEESKEAPKRRNIRNILNVDERLKELLGAKLPQSAATQ